MKQILRNYTDKTERAHYLLTYKYLLISSICWEVTFLVFQQKKKHFNYKSKKTVTEFKLVQAFFSKFIWKFWINSSEFDSNLKRIFSKFESFFESILSIWLKWEGLFFLRVNYSRQKLLVLYKGKLLDPLTPLIKSIYNRVLMCRMRFYDLTIFIL